MASGAGRPAGATVLHLWHPEADRSRLDLNQRQLDQLLAERRERGNRAWTWLAQSIERSRREPAHP